MRQLVLLALLLCWVAVAAMEARADNLLVQCAPKDIPLANAITQNLQPLIDDFQTKIGFYPQFPLRIVIAEDHAAYQKLVSNSSGVLEFSQAHYNRSQQAIYVRHPGDLARVDMLGTVLLHEYIHAYVDHYWRDPPLWFHEGMAVYFTEGVGVERSARYALNDLFGIPLTLPQMSYYPKDATAWETFYTKSALAVQFFYTQHRKEFYTFWDEAPRNGGRFTNALLLSTGMTEGDFGRALEQWLKVKVRWEAMLATSSLIWGLMPLLMMLGRLRLHRKNRRIEQDWEAEIPDEPETD